MTTISDIAEVVTRILILATALVSIHAYRRHRASYRLDILAFVVAIAFVTVAGVQGTIVAYLRSAAIAGVPWLAVRLLHHVVVLPRRLSAAAGLASALVLLSYFGFGHATYNVIAPAYTLLVLAAVGTVLVVEAPRSRGVVRWRLSMAGAGALAMALASVVALVGVLQPSRVFVDAAIVLTSVMLFCFFMAFSPPQYLCRRWQHAEQADFLAEVAERDPEARGANAATDLCDAVARTVSHGSVFVALASRPGGVVLTVRAATLDELVGLELEPGDGPLGRAWRQVEPVSAATTALPAPLAERLAPRAGTVLLAPVAAATDVWGVVGVAQRPGSLFPEDDLRMMAALGQHTGTVLDHARLLADERARATLAADRRLRQVESRMGLMLDSIKDFAMLIVDDRGTVVDWHAGSEVLFGYPAAAIRDLPAAPLFDLSDEAFGLLLHEARELGLARREGPCRRRDGTAFLGTTVIRPLDGDEDALGGFVAVTRDVTERRDLEERLRQSQKMEAIGQLAGGIAHDFNNLLTAIQGYAYWLVDEIPEEDRRRRHVEEIWKASERATGLTRQLLTFSRREMVEAEVVNLARLVADLVPMLQRVIGDDIEIVSEPAADVSPILASPTQMEQVVLNLAVNARDAMSGGGRLTIRTERVWLDDREAGTDAAPGRYVLLEVADTGHGMDASTRLRIFEPFFTTKEPGQGTGLGLATVYGIVRQMGGVIRVDTAVNEGTSFRLYLPETSERARPSSARPVASLEGDETVLVVEDDDGVRQFVGDVLRANGYTVLEASERAHALRAVQAWEGPIHLIVSDVLMPRGSGIELVRALAQVLPQTPSLFISGYADRTLAGRVTFPKGSHFLQKPFSAGELLARIRQLLDSTT